MADTWPTAIVIALNSESLTSNGSLFVVGDRYKDYIVSTKQVDIMKIINQLSSNEIRYDNGYGE